MTFIVVTRIFKLLQGISRRSRRFSQICFLIRKLNCALICEICGNEKMKVTGFRLKAGMTAPKK
ncbi:MAG TPA: hypothetical protein DCQ58_02415 [Saprospirales bacterium]|nr:hypothetical protein [Saprospirales bacterium]